MENFGYSWAAYYSRPGKNHCLQQKNHFPRGKNHSLSGKSYSRRDKNHSPDEEKIIVDQGVEVPNDLITVVRLNFKLS
jgi:hypothetical protein